MHPSQACCLTPHEAARIQGLPDFFVLDTGASRNQLEAIIGNAVPLQLTEVIVRRLIRHGVFGF
jgi:DNA (cytosine-5)-methyltransferase 1